MASSNSLILAHFNFSYKWKIPNLLHRPDPVGKYIASEKFKICDLNGNSSVCRIYLYPKGRNIASSDFIAVFFSSEKDLTVSLSLCILDYEDNKVNVIQNKPGDHDNVTNLFWTKFSRFIERKDLVRKVNALLPDGCLTILLYIGPTSALSCLADNLEQSFLDKDFSDIQITCNGRKFWCHRFMLAARSPVLKAMLQSGFKEDTSREIKLDEWNIEVLKEMLSFLYYGKTTNLTENAVDLLKAAEYFQIDNLKEVCGHHLSRNLDIENAFEYLILSYTHREEYLQKAAIHYTVKNIEPLMETNEWEVNIKKHPDILFDVLKGLAMDKN